MLCILDFEPGRDRVVVGILETDSILGFGKFQGAISMGQGNFSARKPMVYLKELGQPQLKCPVSVSSFSCFLRFRLWTSTAAWLFVPYRRLWQVVSISCCLSWSQTEYFEVLRKECEGVFDHVYNRLRLFQCVPSWRWRWGLNFRFFHVPEADDSLQGGNTMPQHNNQHILHQLATPCSRLFGHPVAKQDTCDSQLVCSQIGMFSKHQDPLNVL